LQRAVSQTARVLHVLLHAPQFFGSVFSFTHVSPQMIASLRHTHFEPVQSAPLGHCVPQAPQLFASCVVSAHVALQQEPPFPHAL
jgi:hypothetical protein